jgi:hypothetical protein
MLASFGLFLPSDFCKNLFYVPLVW